MEGGAVMVLGLAVERSAILSLAVFAAISFRKAGV